MIVVQRLLLLTGAGEPAHYAPSPIPLEPSTESSLVAGQILNNFSPASILGFEQAQLCLFQAINDAGVIGIKMQCGRRDSMTAGFPRRTRSGNVLGIADLA